MNGWFFLKHPPIHKTCHDVKRKHQIIEAKKFGKKEKKEVEINLINNSEITIGNLICNIYCLGFDKIKINFTNAKYCEIMMQKLKTRMIGFDITKRGKDYCIVEKIAEPSEEQFDNILRKLFLSIDELFELTEMNLEKKKECINNFEEIEERIFKYDCFCRRVISKKKLFIKNSEMCWGFLIGLWNAQREIYYLNKFLEENKNIESPKDFSELINHCRSFLKIMEDSFFNKKIEPLGKIHELEPKIINETIYGILKKDNKNGNIVIFRLGACVRQLHLAVSSLIGFLL